jgi:hypothetical protein
MVWGKLTWVSTHVCYKKRVQHVCHTSRPLQRAASTLQDRRRLLPILSAFIRVYPRPLLVLGAMLSLLAGLLLGCRPITVPTSQVDPTGPPLVVVEQPLAQPTTPCTGRFIAHPLDHTTAIEGDVVRMFDSNGAGLAINDLDNDGDLDLVLANLAGPNAIFWNEGALNFRKEVLPHGQSRGVNIVDIDGDGWQEIVFAHRRGRPIIWQNHGPDAVTQFTRQERVHISQTAYTINWADLDGDHDLDAVVGAYDAELQKESILNVGGGGVVYYENRGQRLVPTILAYTAQVLAILLVDLNDDQHLDILVGNDFAQPDQSWLWQPNGWQAVELFDYTPHSTMSYDAGDINNDGHAELFATDMKPYRDDPATQAAWAPLMATMQNMAHAPGDPQIMENVLQVRNADGRFENRAGAAGLAASGWSWSSKFGDLDNDGFLDAYVVNGMAAREMFGHLLNDELVEENQAFRNDGRGAFLPAPEWGLNATASGRSMSMADLDQDGDLDVLINNLLAPALLLENRLCGGRGLEVDLHWPSSHNTRAIGAHLRLHTNTGDYHRSVRTASGYLSGDPARVHFGLPAGSQLLELEIIWPDGQISHLTSLQPSKLLVIQRSS